MWPASFFWVEVIILAFAVRGITLGIIGGVRHWSRNWGNQRNMEPVTEPCTSARPSTGNPKSQTLSPIPDTPEPCSFRLKGGLRPASLRALRVKGLGFRGLGFRGVKGLGFMV